LPGNSFVLIDAGLVENLAAVPLITRGIKKIIIVDSSEDPNYRFDQYKGLQNVMGSMNVTFKVGDIDQFLEAKRIHPETLNDPFTGSPVMNGEATSTSLVGNDGKLISSTIYYIKLSRPKSILIHGETPELQHGQSLARKRDD